LGRDARWPRQQYADAAVELDAGETRTGLQGREAERAVQRERWCIAGVHNAVEGVSVERSDGLDHSLQQTVTDAPAAKGGIHCEPGSEPLGWASRMQRGPGGTRPAHDLRPLEQGGLGHN